MSRPCAALRSLLAGPIGAFLQYKTALGCKYQTEAAALHLLDGFIADQRVVALDQIDPRLIDAFLASRPRAHVRSYNHLVGVTRRFFAWALVQGIVERNPVNACPRRITGQRIPYLFSLAEAQQLLEAARSMRTRPKAPHRALVYETVFALLYGLGLRVGEVTRLLVSDVDFERATLSVRDTKFYKSRLVPFGPRMGERLARYLDQRFGPQADPEGGLMESKFTVSGGGGFLPESMNCVAVPLNHETSTRASGLKRVEAMSGLCVSRDQRSSMITSVIAMRSASSCVCGCGGSGFVTLYAVSTADAGRTNAIVSANRAAKLPLKAARRNRPSSLGGGSL